MMAPLRTLLTIIITVSLAAMPARLAAIGVAATGMVVSAMADCAAMDDAPCKSEEMSAAAEDTMPMSGECDRPGHRGTTQQGACSAFCNSLPAFPTTVLVAVDMIPADTIAPAVEAITDGIGVSPEPHPPKFVLI